MNSASDNRNTTPTNVAVVGHTNTGKTSLIRTLLRDERFGEIRDAAGTTRHVEKTAILAGEEQILTIFDTPGFEDSSALLQTLGTLAGAAQPASPSGLLREFVGRSSDYPEFEQETKVLRQTLASDVLLYIIDVREPILGKYRDEVEILSKAGKPIIPVFNFTADCGDALALWREQMAHFNLHAALEFDTVAFDFEAEKRLYQKLQSLLEHRYDAFQRLIDDRQKVWCSLKLAAAQRIFKLLTEVACYRREVDRSAGASESDIAALQDYVRKLEQLAVRDLLAVFSFRNLDADFQLLAVHDGRWELDLFAPGTLKVFGLNASASALKGAAAGAGIDLMVGGLTLGAATLLGAALGASFAAARRYSQELKAAWQGNQWLCVDDNTISLIYLRQRDLLYTLTRRGHASQRKLELSQGPGDPLPTDWLRTVRTLRQNPAWQASAPEEPEYRQAKSQVVDWLLNPPTKPGSGEP